MSGAQRELDLRTLDEPRFWRYGVDRPETDPTRLWDGLRDMSARLVEVIEHAVPAAPILVAGDWGSGKSSLLEAARQRLRDSHYPTIWFDAWRHEGQGTLLPLLLRTLGQSAPKKLARKVRIQWRWIRLMKATHRLVVEKVPSVAILAGAIGVPHFIHRPLFHFLHLAEPFVHRLGHAHVPGDADAVAVVQRELSRFVDEIVSRKMGRPVIFFIDNLDRCNPEAALSLIESLRILIGGGEAVPEARFVVALDRTALVRAVMLKFKGMSDYDGNRYLEKIFPISFFLPRPEGAAILQFVQSFLGPKDRGKDHSPTPVDDILSLALADPIFANPRLMKRCIERFHMVLKFESKTRRRDARAAPDEEDYDNLFLAKWIAAGERWPDLRRLFSRHVDDGYWLKVGYHLSDRHQDLPDEEARNLLIEQDLMLWLRRELFGTKDTRLGAYRNADLRLRSFGL